MQKKKVLVLCTSSWGAIDWIAPVIARLKDSYKNIEIDLIFTDYNENIFFGKNVFLAKFSRKFFDRIIPFERYKLLPSIFIDYVWKFGGNFGQRVLIKLSQTIFPFLNYNRSKDISSYDVILQELTGSPRSSYFNYFFNPKDKTKVKSIIFPPTSDIYFYLKGEEPSWEHEADYFLVNSEIMANNFLNIEKGDCRKILGVPRYDDWWKDRLAKLHEEFEIETKVESERNTYLLITRGPGKSQLTKENYDYLMRTSIEVILEDPSSYFIVKPHPRECLKTIESFFSHVDKDRWEVSGAHNMHLGKVADVVISFAVSAIFDVLVYEKPVIEYFIYGEGATNYTTDWRDNGFVLPANNKDELRFQINSILNGADFNSGNFRSYFPNTFEKSTESVVEVILN